MPLLSIIDSYEIRLDPTIGGKQTGQYRKLPSMSTFLVRLTETFAMIRHHTKTGISHGISFDVSY
jgi:hypothetical protein